MPWGKRVIRAGSHCGDPAGYTVGLRNRPEGSVSTAYRWLVLLEVVFSIRLPSGSYLKVWESMEAVSSKLIVYHVFSTNEHFPFDTQP
jgi:hypothetical protein